MSSRVDAWVRWTIDFVLKHWKLALGIVALSTLTSLAIKPRDQPLPPDSSLAACSCDIVLETLNSCLDLRADRPKEDR